MTNLMEPSGPVFQSNLLCPEISLVVFMQSPTARVAATNIVRQLLILIRFLRVFYNMVINKKVVIYYWYSIGEYSGLAYER